ncbi:glycosyltransferase family 25 protein [Schlesneria sp. T3-172]|uniref:glycosyltransferase family 25 protein n=1 Tax=Schlesneria sphaerica TaxID=3373610 RepID=UPI0037CBBBCB
MFDRAFVINLPFKTDRLHAFQARYPSCLPKAEVWHALHGDSVTPPDWWTAGNGAWGCYRSHLQILEHCYNAGIESYIVFEDDAIFRPDFDERLPRVLAELPCDWQQLYLGGQLLHEAAHPPGKVTESVFVPFNVNRTHAFAVHRRGYELLYRHLHQIPFAPHEHIDHHLGRLHESGRLKVYCPSRWLVGQDSGPSNISGNNNAATYFTDPERLAIVEGKREVRPVPAIFLESTIDVAVELERRGWHRGHWQNEQRLDRGVCAAMAGMKIHADLEQWYKVVMPEAVREGKSCICLFHPSLNWPCVESLNFARFHRITADHPEEAERQLAEVLFKLTEAVADSAPPRRNLIYHIWPRKGNGVWRWNVEQLLKRIEQFDGVRSIGVATSPEADALVDVQRAFDGVRIDNWIEFPNDPNMGEAQTFVKLLNTLPVGDGSITFRGHAKGVKYDDPLTCRDWTEMLYEICLDDSEHVSATLDQFPVAGPFCVDNRWPGGNRFGWYYSGGFYWFTGDILKKPEATSIRRDYWGAELWPGQHYDRNEIGILFGQNCGHLYETGEVERMKMWLEDWRSQGRNARTAACGS